jgi:LEA14-like dessication related protein
LTEKAVKDTFLFQENTQMKPAKLFGIIALLVLLPSCLSWFIEKPTFNLKEIAITRFSLLEVQFLFGVEIQNPNTFDLKLRALDYTVFFNDQEVGKGKMDQEILIAKSAATLVQIPLQAEFKNFGNSVRDILAGKDLRYKIEGAAIVKATLGSATIPFSKSGEVKIKKP